MGSQPFRHEHIGRSAPTAPTRPWKEAQRTERWRKRQRHLVSNAVRSLDGDGWGEAQERALLEPGDGGWRDAGEVVEGPRWSSWSRGQAGPGGQDEGADWGTCIFRFRARPTDCARGAGKPRFDGGHVWGRWDLSRMPRWRPHRGCDRANFN